MQDRARHDPGRTQYLQCREFTGQLGAEEFEDIGEANVIRHQFAKIIETAAADNMLQIVSLAISQREIFIIVLRHKTRHQIDLKSILVQIFVKNAAHGSGRVLRQILNAVGGDETFGKPGIQLRTFLAFQLQQGIDLLGILDLAQDHMQGSWVGRGWPVGPAAAQHVGCNPIPDARIVEVFRRADEAAAVGGNLPYAAHQIGYVIRHGFRLSFRCLLWSDLLQRLARRGRYRLRQRRAGREKP